MEPISMGAALLGSAGISAGSSLLGSLVNHFTDDSKSLQNREYQRQKEFAQNQLQWRAADAEKAGLSKFAALGGQTSFYTPSYSGSSSGFGEAVAQAGQGVSRALETYALASQREALEGQRLDNENKYLEVLEKLQTLNPSGTDITTGGYRNNVQTTSKDMFDPMSETLFGIGNIQPVINEIVQMNTENPSGFLREIQNTFKISDAELAKAGAYIKTSRKASNAGLPSYEIVFEPGKGDISKKLYKINEALGVYDKARSEAILSYQKRKDAEAKVRGYSDYYAPIY